MTNIDLAAPVSRNGRGAARAKPEANGHFTPDVDAIDTAELLSALRAFRRGDFSVRLPRGHRGINGEIAEAAKARPRL